MECVEPDFGDQYKNMQNLIFVERIFVAPNFVEPKKWRSLKSVEPKMCGT